MIRHKRNETSCVVSETVSANLQTIYRSYQTTQNLVLVSGHSLTTQELKRRMRNLSIFLMNFFLKIYIFIDWFVIDP